MTFSALEADEARNNFPGVTSFERMHPLFVFM
jgi:hypothetical protein